MPRRVGPCGRCLCWSLCQNPPFFFSSFKKSRIFPSFSSLSPLFGAFRGLPMDFGGGLWYFGWGVCFYLYVLLLRGGSSVGERLITLTLS